MIRFRSLLGWQGLKWLVVVGLLGVTALGTLGRVVRDQSAAWAVLMYLPLPLIGLASVGFDLVCCRGRGLPVPRGRFALAGIGLITVLGSSIPLIGWGIGAGELTGTTPRDSTRALRVLHWNVVWGGSRVGSPARWASMRRTIVGQGADLIVLSEAPPDPWLDQLITDLGPTASRVQIENGPGVRYWYKLVVCSRRSLRLIRSEPLAHGMAMLVEAEVDQGGQPEVVRLLVVDGQSHPLQWRTPFLHDIARLCRAADKSGQPIDLVLGDFNSMSRSLGFTALADAGYTLASRSAGTYCGTFPSFAPVYDIDHIWVRRARWPTLTDQTFTDLASDHRGQMVRLGGR